MGSVKRTKPSGTAPGSSSLPTSPAKVEAPSAVSSAPDAWEPGRSLGVTDGSRRPSPDGFLVGGDGRLFPPTSALEKVTPARSPGSKASPPPGRRVDVVYVNGILNRPSDQVKSMLRLAESLSVPDGVQAEVRGIHAATDGLFSDLAEAFADTIGVGRNAAVETLRDKIVDSVLEGKPMNLVLSSQGTIIGSRALKEAVATLTFEEGLTLENARALLAEKVRVLTTGNAHRVYPDGPYYKHLINSGDGVALTVGLGSSGAVPKERLGSKVLGGVGRVLALASAGVRALAGQPGPVYQPGDNSEIVAFPQGRGGAFTDNHTLEPSYLDRMRKMREGLLSTFFIRASEAPGDRS